MVAELHQRALSFLSDARLVGIFEPDEAKAAQRAEGWGCRVYATYQAVLDDPQVDGVFVLAPFEAHEELTLAALRAGKHVLVEKPAGSEVGIERMRAAAAERGLVCMPGHNYAYQPEFQQVRRLVRDGSLGAVRAGWITYAIQHPEAVAASYGGVLQEVMIHHTYLGLALFGPPQRLYASRMEPQWQQLQQDDQAWMTWQYPGGRSLHLFASFAVGDDTADSWMFVLKMLGDKGGATYSWRSAIFRRPLGSLSVGIPAYEDSYVHEDAAFLAAMRGDANAVISPLEDALVASRVLRLAERAHTEMAAVTL
jgi:predicted dehydrogenase